MTCEPDASGVDVTDASVALFSGLLGSDDGKSVTGSVTIADDVGAVMFNSELVADDDSTLCIELMIRETSDDALPPDVIADVGTNVS